MVLSVFVLCLQLVAPGLHSSLQLGSRTGNGDLGGLLGEHARIDKTPAGAMRRLFEACA